MDGGDASAEGESLEALMKGNGHEEHGKGGPCGDREGHADEHAVEQDARLEKQAL